MIVPSPGETENVTATPGTGLPLASLTITDGGMGRAVPAVTVWLFPALIAICVAVPPTTVTSLDVTEVIPVPAEKLSVRGPTRPVIVRFTNVARPDPSVATGFVPESAGPPLAIAAVTEVLAWLTELPAASCNWTTGWRRNSIPLFARSDRWVLKASFAGGPAASVIVPDVKGASFGAGKVSGELPVGAPIAAPADGASPPW